MNLKLSLSVPVLRHMDNDQDGDLGPRKILAMAALSQRSRLRSILLKWDEKGRPPPQTPLRYKLMRKEKSNTMQSLDKAIAIAKSYTRASRISSLYGNEQMLGN